MKRRKFVWLSRVGMSNWEATIGHRERVGGHQGRLRTGSIWSYVMNLMAAYGAIRRRVAEWP